MQRVVSAQGVWWEVGGGGSRLLVSNGLIKLQSSEAVAPAPPLTHVTTYHTPRVPAVFQSPIAAISCTANVSSVRLMNLSSNLTVMPPNLSGPTAASLSRFISCSCEGRVGPTPRDDGVGDRKWCRGTGPEVLLQPAVLRHESPFSKSLRLGELVNGAILDSKYR
jgi:hypothetical protein